MASCYPPRPRACATGLCLALLYTLMLLPLPLSRAMMVGARMSQPPMGTMRRGLRHSRSYGRSSCFRRAPPPSHAEGLARKHARVRPPRPTRARSESNGCSHADSVLHPGGRLPRIPAPVRQDARVRHLRDGPGRRRRHPLWCAHASVRGCGERHAAASATASDRRAGGAIRDRPAGAQPGRSPSYRVARICCGTHRCSRWASAASCSCGRATTTRRWMSTAYTGTSSRWRSRPLARRCSSGHASRQRRRRGSRPPPPSARLLGGARGVGARHQGSASSPPTRRASRPSRASSASRSSAMRSAACSAAPPPPGARGTWRRRARRYGRACSCSSSALASGLHGGYATARSSCG